jgi:hypothetical protein
VRKWSDIRIQVQSNLISCSVDAWCVVSSSVATGCLSRYFSRTNGDPHRSGFKCQTAVHSVLWVLLYVWLSLVCWLFLLLLLLLLLLCIRYLSSFPGLKRSGREVDQSPPSSAKFKNEWGHSSTPPYALMERTRAYSPFLPH